MKDQSQVTHDHHFQIMQELGSRANDILLVGGGSVTCDAQLTPEFFFHKNLQNSRVK